MTFTYALRSSRLLDRSYYYLEDQYMTAVKYDLDGHPGLDILAAEKQEILARLRRAKAARPPGSH